MENSQNTRQFPYGIPRPPYSSSVVSLRETKYCVAYISFIPFPIHNMKNIKCRYAVMMDSCEITVTMPQQDLFVI